MIRRITVALVVMFGLGCLGLICDGGCPACPAGQKITRDCKMGSGVIMDCVCGCAPSETPGAGGSP